MSALNIKARKKSRKLALQAIYQWQLTNAELHAVQAQFLAHPDNADIDSAYFKQLVAHVINDVNGIDNTFKPYLDRDIEALNPIELAILRLGTYELLSCLEIPYKIILNEAIELTKTFGAEDSYKYTNSILDRVADKVRAQEK